MTKCHAKVIIVIEVLMTCVIAACIIWLLIPAINGDFAADADTTELEDGEIAIEGNEGEVMRIEPHTLDVLGFGFALSVSGIVINSYYKPR